MRKGSFLMNLWTVRALVERAMTLTVRGTAAAQVQEVELPVASGKERNEFQVGWGCVWLIQSLVNNNDWKSFIYR